jgi:hypothetical protein
MRRKRFNDYVGACVSPDIRAKLEDVAERRLVSLSELARSYIEEGLAREGIKC